MAFLTNYSDSSIQFYSTHPILSFPVSFCCTIARLQSRI